MKRKLLFSSVLVAGLVIVSFSVFQVYAQTPQKKTATMQIVKYTCPMHPEVVKDQPGNCPKCGMKLVEKKVVPKRNMNNSRMMKHDRMKMMHDSTFMKKKHMMCDTTIMKKGRMMQDSTIMKKRRMMHDTTLMKRNPMKMK